MFDVLHVPCFAPDDLVCAS